MGFITTLLNSVLDLFGSAAISLLSLLPSSPFTWNLNGANTILTWVFWIFPIPSFVVSITAYVTAVALYFTIRAALRWIKIVGG